MRRIEGKEVAEIVEKQLVLHTNGALERLAPLDAADAVRKFARINRGIVELINIDDSPLEMPEVESAFDSPINLRELARSLSIYFDQGVVDRVCGLVECLPFLRSTLARHCGDFDGRFEGLSTVRMLASYLKSRRRHLNSFFYALSNVCTGSDRLSEGEMFSLAFDVTEYTLMSLASMRRKLAMAQIFPEFWCWVSDQGMREGEGYWQERLDQNYLEAERLGITEMPTSESDSVDYDRTKLISTSEFTHLFGLIGLAFEMFDLRESQFGDLELFMTEVVAFVKDDYYVVIPKDAFEAIIARYRAPIWVSRLVNAQDAARPFGGGFAAFVEVDGLFMSDLFLLLRFGYDVRSLILERKKKYQINSGFIFEGEVKKELESRGFEVMPIKRINRKEFDVVAKLNGVFFNLQCKNLRIDHELLETNVALFVRKNRNAVRRFEKALEKEESRQQLLETKIDSRVLLHFVLTKFPVISSNPRILSFRDVCEGALELSAQRQMPA